MLVGAALMLATATVQTFGVIGLEEAVARARATITQRATRTRMLAALLGIIIYLFVMHLLEIILWAEFYLRLGGLQSLSVAIYESAMAFTTMNQPALRPAWIFLGAAEGMTGVLMAAWSTGLMFQHMAWILQARHEYLNEHPWFPRKTRKVADDG